MGRQLVWLCSVVVGQKTYNQQVTGSTPGQCIAEKRPWASCSQAPNASEVIAVWRYRNLSNLIKNFNLTEHK